MKYGKIRIGQKAELSHTITRKEVFDFIALTGDDNSVHTKGDMIVHGMLAVSFISTMIGTILPGHGSIWMAQRLRFMLPVKINDTITIKAEVVGKDRRRKEVWMSMEVFNQRGEQVIDCHPLIKMTE
jgi:3-oxoacyl-[acyl-carrier protein] reductase